MQTYSLRAIQSMLGLSRAVVSRLVAAGFVTPARGKRREYLFGFQDIVLLRTAHELQQARIPTRRILRSLQRLRSTLPEELPLSGLRISAIGSGARVAIGDDSGFSGVVICAAEEIVIGDRVLCGCNVTIVDADWHGLDPARRSDGVGATAPVRIENDAFLGMGVVVLKGVTIGRGSVVGAGSVVTRSIPPMSVAAGNPARVVGQL